MSTKRPIARPKDKWQTDRARYTWHLRPPFDKLFDHSHWWEGQYDIAPAAVIYELARRHPLVGQTRLKFQDRTWQGAELRPPLAGKARAAMCEQISTDLEGGSLGFDFVCQAGLLSWPQLSEKAQDGWKYSCGKIKGVDCRSPGEQCCRIPWVARRFDPKWTAIARRKMRTMSVDKLIDFFQENYPWASLLPWTKRTRMDIERATGLAAQHYHREGYLLLAFAPDLTVDQATALLRQEYARMSRALGPANPVPKQRARAVKRWLVGISEFEEAESRYGGAKSETFDRYRSIMDGIRFTPERVPVWW